MRFSTILPLVLAFSCCYTLAQAQTDDTSKQLDPSATCPYQTGDQIQTCLAQVESDEATRTGGPCTDGDWSCICNKQQGLIDCYKPCPGTQAKEDVEYNNNNCAGQHGVRNAAAGGDATYSGSPLTTSAGAAGGQSTGAAAASTTTSSASTTPSSASATSSPSTTGSSSASSAPSASNSSTGGNTNGASITRGGAHQGWTQLVVGAVAGFAGLIFAAA